jgi:hypothetical protein
VGCSSATRMPRDAHPDSQEAVAAVGVLTVVFHVGAGLYPTAHPAPGGRLIRSGRESSAFARPPRATRIIQRPPERLGLLASGLLIGLVLAGALVPRLSLPGPGGWLDWRPGLQVTHCTLSLCSLAMLLHYALSLCALTMLSHCALSLCSLTVLSHYALPLCALTVLSHCALARPGAILGLSWHNSGCAGGWLVTDSKFSACLVLVSGCPTMAQYGPRGALYSDKI